MRIVILSPWGAGGGYSGPLTFLNRLFGAVKRLDQDLHISLIARDRGSEDIPGWASETILVGRGPARFTGRNQVAWSIAARSALRQLEPPPEVVHLHGTYLLSQAALMATGLMTRSALLPVLAQGDLGRALEPTPKSVVKGLVTRYVVRRAALGIAISQSIADELTSFGMAQSRILNLGNIVSTVHFDITRGRAAEIPTIGFVGKLGWTKQPHIILQALDRLKRRGIPMRGLFVGPFESAAYETMFRGVIETLDLRQEVVLTGMVPDTARFFEKMDVFVLPSRSEGLPGALAEAFASGLPCLGTDVGGMGTAIRDAGAGKVVVPAADAIADAIESFVKYPHEMLVAGRNARAFAHQHYSPSAVAETYLYRVRSLNA